MKKEQIRALEPKYTGNTRHLSEGEAAAIVHDPANEAAGAGLPDAPLLPLGAATSANRNP
ncbi:hypothetical protein SD70_13300 [Gordoniibacillus kamchatkensis]|uniref:Uncharacterized protein n=1 Tax=Gordoniibacillus kamchatkensis TaxID=1590651 RepID=A0ABR5AHL8_9BACL|nr:hypothetical protein [Paenibacillus sp. VKM B-2647]KIL40526.1 hypothetical protein SD70_13300 [Paenibacillus sp. VKM B-2647]